MDASRRNDQASESQPTSKASPNEPQSRELVKRFSDSVRWLRRLRFTYTQLYEQEVETGLMQATAPAFFHDLNRILIGCFLLEAAKLTDQPSSRGGRLQNFTVANLVQTIAWPPELVSEMKPVLRVIKEFRDHIGRARDKLLAHYDREVVLSEAALGGFPDGDDARFVSALEALCDLLHKGAFGKGLGDVCAMDETDLFDLTKALARSVVFDQVLSEATGDHAYHLDQLLQKALGRGVRDS